MIASTSSGEPDMEGMEGMPQEWVECLL